MSREILFSVFGMILAVMSFFPGISHAASSEGGLTTDFSWSTDSSENFKLNVTAAGCPGGHVCTYTWDFGDGDIQTLEAASASHTYADGSMIIITLVITDSTSGQESAPVSKTAVPVSRNIAPVASFDLSVKGWTVTITDTSTDDAPFPANAVRIDWSDGTTSKGNAGNIFMKTYAREGSYTIKMNVTDAEGRRGYAENAQTVVPTKYTISGKAVRLDGTTPVADVSIRLMKGGAVVKMAATQTDGTYILNEVLPDVYVVSAEKADMAFTDQPADASTGNVANVNFTADR